jgi:PhnB protein
MKKLPIPENYQGVMPYIIVKNAAGFMQWCKDVLDATERFSKQAEGGEGIMHAEIVIAGATVMLGDASEQWHVNTAGMFVYVEDADKTYAKALEKGAKSLLAPVTQPYGRTCGVMDPYGNTWWPTTAGSGTGEGM